MRGRSEGSSASVTQLNYIICILSVIHFILGFHVLCINKPYHIHFRKNSLLSHINDVEIISWNLGYAIACISSLNIIKKKKKNFEIRT